MENLTWTEFESRNARGDSIEVNDFPKAKPTYQLTIDFGTEMEF
jgi:hypothetical protein